MKNQPNHTTPRLSLAYLVSCYPSVTHTFILRELEALRARGHEIDVFSVRRPAHPEALGPAEQAEMRTTTFLLPSLARTFLPSLGRMTLHNPVGLIRMAQAAVQGIGENRDKAPKYPFYFAEAVVLLDHLRRRGISHVHNHFGNAAGTVALLAAASGEVDFSLSVHGPDVFHSVTTEALPKKLNAARFVRAISHFCVSQLRLHSDFGTWDRFGIVRCGVDPAAYTPPATRDHDDPPRVLCVGRLTPAKGQLTLLKASLRLHQQGYAHQLDLVGDGPHRPALEAFAATAEMDWVTFHGNQPQAAVRQFYAEADVFVLPSFAEGVPVVLMEAMAMELPVLSTYVAGIPELIDQKKNGRLFHAGDDTQLYRELALLVQNKRLRQRLGQSARQTVIKHYNMNHNGLQMAKLFETHLLPSAA